MKHEPKEKIAKAPKWRRWLLAFGAMLLLLLGAAWYAYDRMTDHLLEVLMDESIPSNEISEEAGTAGQRGQEGNNPLPAGSPIIGNSAPAALKTSATGKGKGEGEGAASDSQTGKTPQAGEGSELSGRDAKAGSKSGKDSKADSESGKDAKTDSKSAVGKDASDAKQSPAGKQASSAKPDISVDEASEAGSKVTMMEKIEIGSVLLKHWSADELKSFQSALSGGLTKEEKRELKRKALAQLSEEEYNKLIEIAKKYGMSQGKSYKKSLEEE